MSATSAARLFLLALLAAFPGAPEAWAQSATPLAEEPEGTVEVSGESRVMVSGLVGEITLQGGPPGVLSFQGRTLDGRREPVPVALWLEGGVFRVGPAAKAAQEPLSVVLSVPPELVAEVEASASKLRASGLRGAIRVRGTQLETHVERCEGSVLLELQGGAARVSQSPGEIEIRGREISATLQGASGRVTLGTIGGRIDLREVGGVEGETEGTQVEIDGAHGPVRLSARSGSVTARNVFLGGEFRMNGALLSVRRARGQVEIESNAEVRFAETDSVRVSGIGASVNGSSNAVSFEMHGDGGTVNLERLGGTATVSGSGLDLTLWHVAAAKIDVATSEVKIDGTTGPLEISGEGSDLRILNAAQEVTIRARGGSLQVLELMGPAQIQAEAERVEVSWGTQLIAKSSSVQNDAGSVSVVLPSGAACRLEAETRYGRIESDLPGIEVSTEGTRASGSLGNGNRSTVLRIVAEGDITLSTRRTQE